MTLKITFISRVYLYKIYTLDTTYKMPLRNQIQQCYTICHVDYNTMDNVCEYICVPYGMKLPEESYPFTLFKYPITESTSKWFDLLNKLDTKTKTLQYIVQLSVTIIALIGAYGFVGRTLGFLTGNIVFEQGCMIPQNLFNIVLYWGYKKTGMNKVYDYLHRNVSTIYSKYKSD